MGSHPKPVPEFGCGTSQTAARAAQERDHYRTAMTCYYAAGTLAETLDSLAAQTHPDFELLAVDDGSGDDTLAILKSWAARDPSFRHLTIEHAGIIPALNAGLEACHTWRIAQHSLQWWLACPVRPFQPGSNNSCWGLTPATGNRLRLDILLDASTYLPMTVFALG